MAESGYPFKIKPSEQGSFTRWAKAHGFATVQAAASAVLANKDKYSPAIVKKANFAKNIGGGSVKSKSPSLLESVARNT